MSLAQATRHWRIKNNAGAYTIIGGIPRCARCKVGLDEPHEAACPEGMREHNMLIREDEAEYDIDTSGYL